MIVDKESLHWHFALDSAIRRVEDLVLDFNIETEANNYVYVGVPEPNELIAVINGFLDETDLFLDGDQQNLQEMRYHLEQRLTPLFEAGKTSAIRHWANTTSEQRALFAQFQFLDFRAKAGEQIPESVSSTEQGWFIEGFCKS